MATNVITAPRADLLAGRRPSATAHRLGGLFARISGWLAERRHYRATVAELSALGDAQLLDVGVLRGEIDAIARQSARRARSTR